MIACCATSVTRAVTAAQTRHNKPVREGEAGTVTEKESPIHHSNAMLYSRKDKIASRIGYRHASIPL